MSSLQRQLPKVLSTRNKTQYEIDRENFEKQQFASIQKAVNVQECPVKEKHIRTAIIGSHQDKGARLFWSCIIKQPVQDNPITGWKFAHILHKLMREGHPQVLDDSQRYTGFITDIGKLWGHLRDGYGRLIAFYAKLLVQKLNFHKKYPPIPGNLNLEESELEKLCANDINSYFELCVDMLDYMDDILALQAQVFGSMDMSRSNSMTMSGQCRLAPLIMCIQDSCQLYDYIVKILFKLHSSLPADTLSGHRERFFKQYKGLKQFYHNSSNLQYFKNLIRVPSLSDNPPNFLQASDISSHVTPVAIVPEPDAEGANAVTPDFESNDLLVDTSSMAADDQKMNDVLSQNGSASPALPDERDQFIEQLMREMNELKQQMTRIRAEDGMLVESIQNRVKEVETELHEMKQIAQSTSEENEQLRNLLSDMDQNSEVAAQVESIEKLAKANEEKFKKMKGIYTNLREEHVTLLRKNGDTKRAFETEKQLRLESDEKYQEAVKQVAELRSQASKVDVAEQKNAADLQSKLAKSESSLARLEKEKRDLETKLGELEEARSGLEESLVNVQGEIKMLSSEMEQNKNDKEANEARMQQQMADLMQSMLVSAIEEGQAIITDAVAQFENPNHSGVTCTAMYLMNRADAVLTSISQISDDYTGYSKQSTNLSQLIKSICDLSHRMGDLLLNGKATANTSPEEQSKALIEKCKTMGDESLALLDSIKESSTAGVSEQASKVSSIVQGLIDLAQGLVPTGEDVKAGEMGDMLDKEMQDTTNAIESAASRIADILEQSREQQTGIQLEVNERILDSCNGLMKAIKVMIEKSKTLQREIVSQGRGSASQGEFYKRHHRWTEGLISAAKSVGFSATVLVDSADRVVQGNGKFEELMVCSQEIAASTAQLVVASKVKAKRDSENLPPLSEASREVTQATGEVMANAKSAAKLIDEQDTLDFSNLTLTQSKRFEMNSQVRVLELESNLEKERVKLAALRKKHYQLAGESEGWEVEEESES